MSKKIIGGLLVILAITGLVFLNSCEKQPKEVELVYVEWSRATAITHVAAEILEDLGYDVSVNSVANAAMWQSVASGDSDALLCAWLPVTHSSYYGPDGEFTDEVVDLGPNYRGASLGLVVPEYVTVDSIPEMVENAERFDNEIIGIDPGAGMMQSTEDAINNDTSGLGVFELVEGSGATMAAALGNAIDNEEWIVVTGWRPHWKFGRWDLKILDDPEGIYGESETINTVVRQGLQVDMPEAYEFFAQFDWLSVDLGEVLVANYEGADPEESAEEFVAENRDLIRSALPASLADQFGE
ncbi:MAG: glycine betaine ABC transporter substrate-binding protein [Spirochaetia bacterium]